MAWLSGAPLLALCVHDAHHRSMKHRESCVRRMTDMLALFLR